MIHDQLLFNAISQLKERDYTPEVLNSLYVYNSMNLSDKLKVLIQEHICFASQIVQDNQDKEIVQSVSAKVMNTCLSSMHPESMD